MMSGTYCNTKDILQYAPLQSFVQNSFWHKLSEIKLDLDRLSQDPKRIYGFFTNRNAKSCLLEVDYSAFNKEFKPLKHCYAAHGTLYNKNTVEEFKECDKQELLAHEGQKLLEDIKQDNVLSDPSLLSRFLILSFADLKCHTYYYWFAFPCPVTPTFEMVSPVRKLSNTEECKAITDVLEHMKEDVQSFFILNARQAVALVLKDALPNLGDSKHLDDVYFCFMDGSEYEQPSWIMRIYAAYLLYKCPQFVGKCLRFLGVRYTNDSQYGSSRIWQVCQNDPNDFADGVKFLGWEPNRNSRMGPRIVNLEKSMNPEKLAESSMNLNLKLMKWRLLPDLNLERIADTKCLLFGAGTLGCAVARNLLSWGFKHISLVDSGKVGYSNPVRQSLYRHSDAVCGNAMKATCAADRLREINPNAITTGHVVKIPMPGHTVGESLIEETSACVDAITELSKAHDVLFLLTDSRESRWLPTLLGAVHDKIVINAALGFDSFLVMRHGCKTHNAVEAAAPEIATAVGGLNRIHGTVLGCYFCNDVTAPGNSQKDRTLDQQCTVTRPGVSNIAASYACELLVSLLHHPEGASAPAYYCSTSANAVRERIPEGMLGIIPHSIRGNLYNFENILPATEKFAQCIACSEKVIEAYRSDGKAMLFRAFETAKYLEDLTGISSFKELSSEIIDYDESDLEMSDE